MNTANKLTMCRVVMIPIFIVLLYLDFSAHLWVALGIFILASITDFVDGYVARHYNQITDFGKFMDPLADKLLVMSAMAWFVQVAWMPAWAFFIVIARELAVTGLRLVAVEQGRVIAAGKSGKVKTASTMVGICLMLAFPGIEVLRLVCVIVILVTTVYSGIEYFIQNKDVLGKEAM
ncbi:MAG: CDP-diacylglycerol--glycerol-3-phosphate 3-phosphatidyltransferase [Clostridiales bacterium]|nr:CDP-diacylglycerol--glycerol-3-phosphate 3-phosphatidyltransferase [Clostridiales bacterium]